MTKEREWYNCHHIIGKKNKAKFNVDLPMNKIVVEKIRHQALNCLMREAQDPRGQLDVLVNERRKNTLWIKAEELFEALRTLPDNEFYKEKLVKKPYRKK